MPTAIYRNDGSGRDAYVNGASLSESLSRAARAGPGAAGAPLARRDDFWPDARIARQRAKLDGRLGASAGTSLAALPSATMSSTMASSPLSSRGADTPRSTQHNYSPPQLHSPTSSAAPCHDRLPAIPVPLFGGTFVSPRRELGRLQPGFESRGAAMLTPRSAAAAAGGKSVVYETEAHAAARTGRYALPSAAPRLSPQLPGLALHQSVGILNEV